MHKRPPALLEKTREVLRLKHYAQTTEESSIHWIKQLIHYCKPRHSRELSSAAVKAFLTRLAVEQKVSASTQNQALSALLFLYREVLQINIAIRWAARLN